jgi:hypothetical protein
MMSGSGDGHALLLAARRSRGQLVGVLGHLHLVQQRHGPAGPLAARVGVAEVHGQHDVLEDGQCGQQLEELEDHPHVLAAPDRHLPLAQGVDGRVADQHLAGGGPVDAGDHVDQGGLAAARLADHGHELAAVHQQVDLLECGELAGRGLVGLGDRAQLDQVGVAVAVAVRLDDRQAVAFGFGAKLEHGWDGS